MNNKAIKHSLGFAIH